MKPRNILVVTQWGFEEGLIQSYTLPYLKIIHKVNPGLQIYLITQEKQNLEKDKIKGLRIREELKGYNIIWLPEKYFPAGIPKYFSLVGNFLKQLGVIFTKRIAFIHTFCTPAGGYGYVLSRVTGRKLVVDSYEPHAEYMLECGVWEKSGIPFRVLNALEKKQAAGAEYLIATTQAMIEHTKQRFGIDIEHSYVKPACVDLDKFRFDEPGAARVRKDLELENKIIAAYAGKFGDFYLKEEVFEFFKVAFEYWKERFHVLLLSDMPGQELTDLCSLYGLERSSFTLIKAPHRLVPQYLSVADFGLSPYKPTPSKRFCTPIKNGEYWAIGLPVVITKDISVDSEIIEQNNIGYVLKELNPAEYRRAVEQIDSLLTSGRALLRDKIRHIAENQRSYAIAEAIYDTIYK